jgi:uncharacterized protein (TIGR02996 family)
MTVYFVYRSHYQNPGCKHVRTFDAETVLDWFGSIWKPIPAVNQHAKRTDPACDYAEKLIGRRVYSFGSLFTHIAERNWGPPKNGTDLYAYLEEALYVNEMNDGPHHVEILTDDDELEMAIYIFDDYYARKYPDRAAFLMRQEWRLPDGAGPAPFKPKTRTPKLKRRGQWEGSTYLTFLTYCDSGSLSDLKDCQDGHLRIDGVRLPDLPRYLLAVTPEEAEKWQSGELRELRDALRKAADTGKGYEKGFLSEIEAYPADDAAWAAYSDWLQERGQLPAGQHLLEQALRRANPTHSQNTRDRAKDQVLVQSRVAQACLHTARWNRAGDLYHHWALFDDLWASAHADLANSLLRFASRWDVL